MFTDYFYFIPEERMEEKQDELREEHERILKRFFKVGVTPDCAQSTGDRKALEGSLKLYYNQMYFIWIPYNSAKASKIMSKSYEITWD